MAISEQLQQKVDSAIRFLQTFEPPEGYYLAFSGGKDSCVIKALADMAKVKYRAVYRNTGVDPPELVRFIKEHHPDVEMQAPRYPDGSRITMWNLIPKKLMPPTRICRYCCDKFKEDGCGDGMFTITGVRWAESSNRRENQGAVTINGKRKENQKFVDSGNFRQTKRGGIVLANDNDDARRMIESCYKRRKTTINPIIDWSDDDVWEFIHGFKIPYCCLYDEGFKRLGCIGCPVARPKLREAEFARWPGYKKLYIRAFDEMLKERQRRGRTDGSWKNGTTGEDVFNWWMEYDILPGQIDVFELMEDE